MEVISLYEMPWKYAHHRSSFLPHYQLVENYFESLVSSDIVVSPQTHVLIQNIESEGKLRNINKTTLINILVKPGVIDHIHLGHNYYSQDIITDNGSHFLN